MDLSNLDKNKKYILSGATIRELAEAARTAQLLPGKGYELDIMPAKGTRLKLGAGAGGAATSFPWDLVGDDPYVLNPGTILDGTDTMGSLISVSGIGGGISLSDGDWAYLVIEPSGGSVDISLDTGSWPLSGGALIEVSESDGEKSVESVIYPLWRAAGGEYIRYAPPCHLVVTWGWRSYPASGGGRGFINAPWLECTHRG